MNNARIIEAPTRRAIGAPAQPLAFPQFAQYLPTADRFGWFAKVEVCSLIAEVSRLDGEAEWTVDSLVGDAGVQWANGAGSRSGLTHTLAAPVGRMLDSQIGR